MDTAQELAQKHHLDLYNRYDITLTEGKGIYVTDSEGNEYMDALAGIAVNTVGHCHPNVVKAIQDQAAKLIHVSNLYYTEPQSKLAQLLTDASGMDLAFFCNSGGEAVEGSIKLARKYAKVHGRKGKIISMKNCFHGRTIATISMGKKKYYEGFKPKLKGFDNIPFNDIKTLKKKVDDDTIGVILEPIQGEGGIHPATDEFMKAVRKVCDETGALMILDEIQCGVARTGSMYAYQQYDVQPDIVATAKALGGGFPIGGVLASKEVADALEYGEHGTTYGGNPLACAAAHASLSTIIEEDLATQAAEKGEYFMNKVREVAEGWDAIKEVRGKGLMIGVELSFEGKEVVNEMMKQGILSNCASNTVMRIVPPLIITKDELDRLFDVLIDSIKKVEENHG